MDSVCLRYCMKCCPKEDMDRFEHAFELKEREGIRKKNVADFFLFFSRHHREWLHGLAWRYKAAISSRGDIHGMLVAPMIPTVILPSYYDSTQDKEIAVFAGLLLADDSSFEQVQAFRELLGDNPFEWFGKREFVRLSFGRVQDRRTGGVENWKIARLFDRLWNECCGETATHNTIGAAIEGIASVQRCSYFDVLSYLIEDCGIGHFFYRLRLLLMVLGTRDGIGIDLWEIPKAQLLCPVESNVRLFIQTWFPDYRRYGSVDDAIRLFGFDGDCDFLYACWGYKELQKASPKECGQYATRYNTWYGLGSNMKKNRWKGILPKIPF